MQQTKRGHINTININANLLKTFQAANVQVPIAPYKFDMALPMPNQNMPKMPQTDFSPKVKPIKTIQKNLTELTKVDNVAENTLKHSEISEPTLLIYQTHKWNPHIQEYFLQLYASAKQHLIDVVIIAVSDKTEKIDVPVNVEVLSPSMQEISSMYPTFHPKGLWACNHWLLMWVWKYYAQQKGYTRIWSFEYDIRSNGDLSSIWSLDSSFDYITTKTIHKRNPKDTHFWGAIPGLNANWTALKQVFRVSDTFLDYLHSQFLLGLTGQDEMTLATHAKEPKGHPEFKISSLDNFLSRHWSPNQNPSLTKDWAYYKTLKNPQLKLFHPIK